MKAFILGSGYGKRLSPFTYNNAKFMIPIFDVSLLEINALLLSKIGIDEIITFSQFDHTKEINSISSKIGVKIKPMIVKPGYASLWKGIIENRDDTHSLVLNGDIFLTEEWVVSILNDCRTKSDLILYTYDGISCDDGQQGLKSWIIKSNDRIISYSIENQLSTGKPIIQIGMSLLSNYALELINKLHLKTHDPWVEEIIPYLLKCGVVIVESSHNAYWKDIGTWTRLRAVHTDIITHKFDEYEYLTKDHILQDSNFLHKSSNIHSSCQLYKVIVGSNVILNSNVKLNNCIICKDTVVESNKVALNSIVIGCNTHFVSIS